MSLAQGHIANFKTLSKAFENDDVALMECTDVNTGEAVAVICMVNRMDGDIAFVPVARMFNGNPYEELVPPTNEEDINAIQQQVQT
jgi:hypothetical protein